MERIVGTYTGSERGALVVVFGAIHGNEPAGARALHVVFQLLEQKRQLDPNFVFRGALIGLIGNLQAFSVGKRFIDRDANRLWSPTHIRRILQNDFNTLQAEDREVAELLDLIHTAIHATQPEALVLLDLHTTSAGGGVFCIPTDDQPSLRLARELHAPVILDMLQGIEGTLLHYAKGNHFEIGGFPKYSIAVAFEAGQHDDPLSEDRSVAAIINCLCACGCIEAGDVENQYNRVLLSYSQNLPKVTRLRYVHRIRPGDQFRMRPGYLNFQPVQKGEHLADDITGPVLAPETGLMLMPLYQPMGSDGFFIIQELMPLILCLFLIFAV